MSATPPADPPARAGSSPRFETERLWLTPTAREDAAFLLELMNAPDCLEFIGDRNIRSHADAEQYVKTRIEPSFARFGFGNFTLRRRSDGRAIGSCGLYDRPGIDGVDIGFALLPAYYGQGYAIEAARKVLALAFDYFALERVVAITRPHNIASQKVIDKLGMAREGELVLPGHEGELLWLYGIARATRSVSVDRLFVYGSLAPGAANAHILEAVGGDWQPARVRGRLREAGWGAELGFPGLDLGETTDLVPGLLFSSDGLAAAWEMLDAFEGAEYRRVRAPVEIDGGATLQAWLYVLAGSDSPAS